MQNLAEQPINGIQPHPADEPSALLAPADALLAPADALSRFVPTREIQATETEEARGAQGSTHSYGFTVGDIGLLYEQGKIGEVIENADICPIPNTAEWLQGIVNVRGNLIPVFDLRLLLGLPDSGPDSAKESSNHLLVIDRGEKAVAIPISEFPRSIDVSQPSRHALPVPEAIRDFAGNTYLTDDHIWIALNFDAFFDSLSEGIPL